MNELKEKVLAYNLEVKQALQAVYDALNAGQKKKILKDPVVAALFERYSVEVGDE